MDVDTSDSYLVLERMIREREVTIAELQELLFTLEGQEMISLEEHKALLQLAAEFKIDTSSQK